ncbi:MAG: SufD family Fe-S cluster assembly protein [Lachnospiraceae bacterium]|nr:SufD family Fe-S cluster assembly protein [Lachnospiraceae bacterium]
MESIKINRMKAITNSWLKINDTDMEIIESPVVSEALPKLTSGAGEGFDRYVAARSKALDIVVTDGNKERKRLDIAGGFHYIDVKQSKNSKLDLIVDVKNSEDNAYVLICAELEDYATLNIIKKVENVGKAYIGFAAKAGDSAQIHAYDLFMGGEKVTYGSKVVLEGYKSQYDAKVGYITCGSEKLDLNYLTEHYGKKSISNLDVGGVMKDRSEKTFRGTIDFIRGCKGSEAAENESVILIDQGVKNKSVPTILCTEEDVKGEHGDSIGKIEDDTRFYLESRGLDEASIVKLVSEAKLYNVIRQIPDDEFKKELIKEEQEG